MSSWEQLMNRQARERKQFLRILATKGLSVGEGAKLLAMSPQGFLNLLKREGIEWKKLTRANQDQLRKPRISVERYRECAEKGMSISETSRELDVCYNAVKSMSVRHKIKFTDGRTKKYGTRWPPTE
jgi:orotate phosphoribosyltransferase-like protein